MFYLTTPSSPAVREAMSRGEIGCMTTPSQGNRIPPGSKYACDNGKFGKGWPGADKWFEWLSGTVDKYGAESCLWAVAPDVPMDSNATLSESTPFLPQIRNLGVPVAYAAQDGSERDGMIPWDSIDVLFLAGSTEWKLSNAAAALARQAIECGKKVHMGRVNSWKRFFYSASIGCSTSDGTYIAFGPDANLPKLKRWIAELKLIEKYIPIGQTQGKVGYDGSQYAYGI